MNAPIKKGPYLVNDFLEQSATIMPDKVALVCDGQRLTYSEINAMANQMANALLENGIAHGDRVLMCMQNSIELVVSIFGTLKAQGVFVVVNATTKPDKLLYLVQNCRASAIVLPASQAKIAAGIFDCAETLKFAIFTGKPVTGLIPPDAKYLYFNALLQSHNDTQPFQCLAPDDLACLIYTSGSTGEPKGVMSGHDNVVFAVDSITTYLENTPEDIILNVMPVSFDYGLYQLLMVFKIGGTLVLERSFVFPARALQLMAAEKVTGFPGVPTLFSILLKMDLTPYDFSSLRYITNTAAALPAGHIRAIRDKFPGVSLYSMYGLTETKRTLYLPPDKLDECPGSVGIAIPGTEVWLEDESGNRLGPNQIGELVIRGPHVMRGYWENPEATAKRYRPGPGPGERVCYSDDLFRMDDKGYFYFVGRKDDIIKSRGEKVAPKEVESILYDLPDVVEAAVVGVIDPLLGQAIKAYLSLQPGSMLTQRDVLRHCRANLEDYMVPQLVEFRDTLPKNASGKIMKTALV